MKHKILGIAIASALVLAGIAGCTPASGESTEAPASEAAQTTEAPGTTEEATEESSEETEAPSEETEEPTEAAPADDVTVRVGSLHGPTTIGILSLMQGVEDGSIEGNYEFTEMTQPDELAAQLNSGAVDIAMIPANMASILYNRTEGGISVIDINTLGVIECISGDETVNSVSDLSGRTVYSIGQGATPEYALNYLLEQYGVTDCTVEFRAEAGEIVALLAEDPMTVAILPQPAATAQSIANDALSIRFSFTSEWDAVTDDSILITGVTVVRNDFLADHPDAVNAFIAAHADSVQAVSEDLETVADLACEHEFFNNANIAVAAIPNCNTVCITGEEMKTSLSGYLETLFVQNPDSIGGAMPADDFYYLG